MEKPATQPLLVGNMVQLVSGGPPITLVGIEFKEGNHWGKVKWFEDGSMKEDSIPLPALCLYGNIVDATTPDGLAKVQEYLNKVLQNAIQYADEATKYGVNPMQPNGVESGPLQPTHGYIMNAPDKEELARQKAFAEWRKENPDAPEGPMGPTGIIGHQCDLGLPKAPEKVRIAVGRLHGIFGHAEGFSSGLDFHEAFTLEIQPGWQDLTEFQKGYAKIIIHQNEWISLPGLDKLWEKLSKYAWLNPEFPLNVAQAEIFLKEAGLVDFTKPFHDREERFKTMVASIDQAPRTYIMRIRALMHGEADWEINNLHQSVLTLCNTVGATELKLQRTEGVPYFTVTATPKQAERLREHNAIGEVLYIPTPEEERQMADKRMVEGLMKDVQETKPREVVVHKWQWPRLEGSGVLCDESITITCIAVCKENGNWTSGSIHSDIIQICFDCKVPTPERLPEEGGQIRFKLTLNYNAYLTLSLQSYFQYLDSVNINGKQS